MIDVFSDVAADGRSIFRDCAFAAAHEIGVFNILRRDGWISTNAAAMLLGVRGHRLGPLLGALAVESVVQGKRDTDRILWRLVETPPCPTVMASGLGLLGTVLREDVHLEADERGAPGSGSPYLSYLAERAKQTGGVLMAMPEIAAHAAGGKLLDAGGGHGEHCAIWLRKDANNIATLVDIEAHLPAPAVLEFGDRCAQVGGDLQAVELPTDHDVALLCNVLHLHTEARAIGIAEATARALRPGGTFVIKEVLLDELHRGPAAGAYFSVSLVAYTQGGRGYEVNELRRMVEIALGCGPSDVKVHREPSQLADQVVLTATKPGV
jgi:SAM-dependent methyltransferase